MFLNIELAREAVIKEFVFLDNNYCLTYCLLRQILCSCMPPIITISFILVAIESIIDSCIGVFYLAAPNKGAQ